MNTKIKKESYEHYHYQLAGKIKFWVGSPAYMIDENTLEIKKVFIWGINYAVNPTRFEDNGEPCDNCVDITVTYNIGNNTFVNQDKLFYKYEIKELL